MWPQCRLTKGLRGLAIAAAGCSRAQAFAGAPLGSQCQWQGAAPPPRMQTSDGGLPRATCMALGAGGGDSAGSGEEPLSRREFARALGAATVWGGGLWAALGSSPAVAEGQGEDSGVAGSGAESEEVVDPVAAPAVGARELNFEVPYNGKSLPLSKFLGAKATLVVNPKFDDPISLTQMPGLRDLFQKYSSGGLNVLFFPTDQGYFEADDDRLLKTKLYQVYGFGQYPKAVVFDKTDIVGTTIHPLYRYMCKSLRNPNGIARVTLDFEKFLLDADGVPVRRYPRKLDAVDFEEDVKAVLEGRPLPPENRAFKVSWLKANEEAGKSEYAFKLGLNYYNNVPNSKY